MSRIYHDEWLVLSVESSMTACNLLVITNSGRDFLLDRGDGSAITQHASGAAYINITLSGVSSGIKVKSLNGALTDIGEIINYTSTGGNFVFDLSIFTPCLLLSTIYFESNNKITGDLADLPKNLKSLVIGGSNMIYGNIGDLPSGLLSYYTLGFNTTSGDIANLPSGLLTYKNHGNNTTSGDIANLPGGLTYYDNQGLNTTSGEIAGLPSGLIYYDNRGSNTTSGNMSGLPGGLTYYVNIGSNTVDTYISPRVWATDMNYIFQPNGLSSTEVDDILIDLSSITTWAGFKTIYLGGTNGARTGASNAAVSTLVSNGVTVITN